MSKISNYFGTQVKTQFFYEGPEIKRSIVGINSSSINPSTNVDTWRQGVEITQLKHHDAGFVKITAGEPGHIIRQTLFGVGKSHLPDTTYKDLDLFNPVTYIQSQKSDLLKTGFSAYSFPIVTSDFSQADNFLFNGVIEPFPIRQNLSFSNLEFPYNFRTIVAHILGGNLDHTLASDRIVSIDYYDVSKQQRPYKDMVGLFANKPLAGVFEKKKAPLGPFDDGFLNMRSGLGEFNTLRELKIVNTPDNSFISNKKRSATAGFDYNNNASIGTDSIAFGGKLY